MSSVRDRVAQLERRLPPPPSLGPYAGLTNEQLVARMRALVPGLAARWRRGADPVAADQLRRLVDVRYRDAELEEGFPVVLQLRGDLRRILTSPELQALGVPDPDAGR